LRSQDCIFFSLNRENHKQGRSGAGTRRSAVPANIFQPNGASVNILLITAGTLLQRSGKSGRYLCTEFGQLVLRKIIDIVTITCLILRLNCTKFDFFWGSTPSDSLAGYKGPTTKGGEGKGARVGKRGRMGRSGRGEKRKEVVERVKYATTPLTIRSLKRDCSMVLLKASVREWSENHFSPFENIWGAWARRPWSSEDRRPVCTYSGKI